ncbi:hypothetical protein BCT46_15690 [Vibrio sp. 10N.261.46.E8]|nr:hypothetical protein BH584_05510 [Vibrio sp. 10N.261.45.E1]PMJ34414.1 hypothetical protein BCU27_03025 [Vibrio sp. 10N.286.45.B6]PML86785.1 hypothetical protein BCT66_00730 [Vibrio sp. 10N.261.49.E11]PMM76785.1 hypothetical protein BCT48_24605 [Vibrio sp. 10N.261.46.F12]PMM81847.1 hypothetical protein BCT46_15690 [Vibrio sp. 10N.261.46.E8]PMN80479.1 hypothetical protein BCT25_15575 [Vibrio sp. 10N.261.45.A6]PMN83703.1 hypothetical protein BCT22_11865 [Vibrio sp. 10N.261.45.A1]
MIVWSNSALIYGAYNQHTSQLGCRWRDTDRKRSLNILELSSTQILEIKPGTLVERASFIKIRIYGAYEHHTEQLNLLWTDSDRKRVISMLADTASDECGVIASASFL